MDRRGRRDFRRKPYRNQSAARRAVGNLNRPSHTLTDGLANRESKTRASALSAARRVTPIERLEDMSLIFAGDAWPLILNRQPNRPLLGMGGDSHSRPLGAVLQCVEQD